MTFLAFWSEYNRLGASGGRFQRRNYWAARWLPINSKHVPVLLGWLEEGGVWTFGTPDQEQAWSFLVELLVSAELRPRLWEFATRKPERVILKHAVQIVFPESRAFGTAK